MVGPAPIAECLRTLDFSTTFDRLTKTLPESGPKVTMKRVVIFEPYRVVKGWGEGGGGGLVKINTRKFHWRVYPDPFHVRFFLEILINVSLYVYV